LRSDKGPWNDPELLKIARNPEARFSTISEEDYLLVEEGTSMSMVFEPLERNKMKTIEENVSEKHIDAVDKFMALSLPPKPHLKTLRKGKEPQKKDDSFLVGGVIAFVMGIVAMLRLSKAVPRKLTDVALLTNSVYYEEAKMSKPNQDEVSAPPVSSSEYVIMVKRMAELEEKYKSLDSKSADEALEKDDKLQAALNRVQVLEHELSETKKALDETMVNQQGILAYIEKKNKKKRMFFRF
jgi:hypothetical protein